MYACMYVCTGVREAWGAGPARAATPSSTKGKSHHARRRKSITRSGDDGAALAAVDTPRVPAITNTPRVPAATRSGDDGAALAAAATPSRAAAGRHGTPARMTPRGRNGDVALSAARTPGKASGSAAGGAKGGKGGGRG